MSNEVNDEFVYTWRIKKYHMCYHKFEESITSPEFTAENIGRTRWYLEFFPKGDESEEFCKCYLHRSEIDEYDSDITVMFSIELLDPCYKSEIYRKTETECTFPNKNDGFGFNKLIKIDDLLNKLKNWTENTLTIRCKISRTLSTNKLALAVGCNATTEFLIERCAFTWRVADIDIDDWTESKKFIFPNASQFKVTLSFPKDQLTVAISKEKATSDHQFVCCKITLIDLEGNEITSKRESYHFVSKDNNNRWKFNVDEIKEFETNGLHLVLEFCSSNSCSSVIVNYVYSPLMDTLAALQNDMCALYISKNLSDVKLKVENRTFLAHKSILSARSPVFCAMFSQDMLENQTETVEIQDCDGKTITSFLQFLYTGAVDSMDYESALKLLVVADKYQVASLKEKCSSYLISIICIENVCVILYVADMIGHNLLKTSAIDYISAHSGKILQSPEWFEWIEKNFKLGIEVMCKVSTILGASADKASVE